MASSPSSPSNLTISSSHRRRPPPNLPVSFSVRFFAAPTTPRLSIHKNPHHLSKPLLCGSGGGNSGGNTGSGGGGGGGDEGGDSFNNRNRNEALIALAEMGRSLESIPADLAAAVDGGRIPAEIVRRFGELEKSAVARWFMQFAGFRERLLADELFLLKLNMECGVGIFTKRAKERGDPSMADSITSSASSASHLRFPHYRRRPSTPPAVAGWPRRRRPLPRLHLRPVRAADASGGGGGNTGNTGGSGGGGGDDGDGENRNRNREEALLALAALGRTLGSIPADLAAAVEGGRIPGEIVNRFAELEKSPLLRWLMQFAGFKERLLADDLFLAKVAMECGVGILTKTAAEYERRRENFVKEIDFVIADLVMAIIADFMLVWLPAPTVSLRPPLAMSAGTIAKFFHNCPDNAFQVALSGSSFSFLQRIGAIVRNGSKLFVVGTTASLIGTGITNALINSRKAFDKDQAVKGEDVPILETSVAYGVYMAVSSNLRYQVLAGVIEQRMLEPLLHKHKLMLSAICFAVRTGNTFLGSLLWVDYARWVGIQKSHD